VSPAAAAEPGQEPRDVALGSGGARRQCRGRGTAGEHAAHVRRRSGGWRGRPPAGRRPLAAARRGHAGDGVGRGLGLGGGGAQLVAQTADGFHARVALQLPDDLRHRGELDHRALERIGQALEGAGQLVADRLRGVRLPGAQPPEGGRRGLGRRDPAALAALGGGRGLAVGALEGPQGADLLRGGVAHPVGARGRRLPDRAVGGDDGARRAAGTVALAAERGDDRLRRPHLLAGAQLQGRVGALHVAHDRLRDLLRPCRGAVGDLVLPANEGLLFRH